MSLIFNFEGEDLTIELRQHDDYVSGELHLKRCLHEVKYSSDCCCVCVCT